MGRCKSSQDSLAPHQIASYDVVTMILLGVMEFLILPIFWLALAAFSGQVASSKGYSGTLWGLARLAFGPIALLATLGLSDLNTRRYLRFLAEQQGWKPAPDKSAWL